MILTYSFIHLFIYSLDVLTYKIISAKMFESNTDLIYSSTINHSQYNFLYVSDEFLETLEENGEIVVQSKISIMKTIQIKRLDSSGKASPSI